MSEPERDVITVLLADDDARYRSVHRKLFDRTEGFRVVGEAANGAEAVRLVEAWRPAVALLDVQMPGMSGLEAAHPALHEDPDHHADHV